MGTELADFVHSALKKGKSKQETAAALKQAGWGDEQVRIALNAYADVDFAVPVPRPKPLFTARETFLYLVMYSALYCCCFHVGSLAFDLINLHFPDAMDNARSYFLRTYQDSIRSSVSALVISLPVFFFTFRLLHRQIAKDPAYLNSRPRKWLTYLTLFIATLALMSDGGALVYNVLAGEVTARFLLKAATVALIAGGIFYYFLHDMRQEDGAIKIKLSANGFSVMVAVITILVVAAAVCRLDSPNVARGEQLDRQRVEALKNIKMSINSYRTVHSKLPQTLSELNMPEGATKDVISQKPYGYSVAGANAFKLCAVFDTAVTEMNARCQFEACVLDNHTSGEQCFTFGLRPIN